jgi:protein-S-isoprenylcysteine O-methyltransferase Ste14
MLLFAFLLVYFLTTFALPSWLVWKNTGINPVVLPKDDSVYGFVGGVFKWLIALVFFFIGAKAFAPERLVWLFPSLGWLESPLARAVGWSFLLGSWLLIVVAQRTMRQSWRIGIDENEPTELVQNGLFALSRNPIFLGMVLTLAGLFLVMSNALTLLVAVVSWVVISVQIRLEEEFLVKQHGQTYRDYCQKVGRWV